MKVTFMDGRNEKVLAQNVTSQEEGFKVISDFLRTHNYKSYYVRYWRDEERKATQCDVGSWSQFFYLYDD